MSSEPTQHGKPAEALIEVRELRRTFDDGTAALTGINVRFFPGEFVMLAGRNGSGKTVFIRHLNALYRPSSGSVLVDGVPAHTAPRETRRRVGLVFQDADSQIVGQTVAEDIAFGPQNLLLPEEEVDRRVERALELSGLTHLAEHRPRLLSGGEKRRLAIAGVLAMDPQVIILDEPFSNLDYPGVVSVLRQVIDLHRRGHTVIIVTHEVEKACAHAQRLLVFEHGRIVLDGAPREVLPEVSRFGIRVPPGSEHSPEQLTWLN